MTEGRIFFPDTSKACEIIPTEVMARKIVFLLFDIEIL